MEVSIITSSLYNQKFDKRCKSSKVAFNGNLGDKFVREIASNTNITPKTIIQELKGTFGFKSDKIEDVLESFIGKIKDLTNENNSLSKNLDNANTEILSFSQKTQQAIDKTKSHYENIIRNKDEALIKAQQEAKEAKELAAKYEPMAKVKSIDEIDTILPKQAIKTLDDINTNKIAALKSMYEFLTTGKGQEEAIKQIDRFNVMHKAAKDKITEIPEVANKLGTIDYKQTPSVYTVDMIKTALIGAPKGDQIISPPIQAQVKDNAMGLINLLVEKEHTEYYDKWINRILDECVDFHKRYANGLKILKEGLNPNSELIKHEAINFDTNAIAYTLKNDGYTRDFTFNDISLINKF